MYGAPQIPNRQEVWNQLTEISDARQSPWFLTGDFNEITDNSEKSGGRERPESSFSAFRSFLSMCDLFDLKHSGNFLSWRGKRHTHLVHCRRDRALANSAWSDLFPNGRSHYLKFDSSDHRPLLSVFDSKRKKPQRLFRYDRRLRGNAEIKLLVDNTWKEDPTLTVAQRLSRVRRAISIWSRKHYVNSQKDITSLKEELDVAMSASYADDIVISAINHKLLKAYKSEEEYWKQRSRQMWLMLGDRNTGFFHASTKSRRARNRLTVIEDQAGVPVFEDHQITELISDYFQRIFTSPPPQRRN